MTSQTLVLFTRFGMGDAPVELQHKLAVNFATLLTQDCPPGALVFYGEGVKLVCEGSPVLDQLRVLAEKGSPLLVCRSSLDALALHASVRVGLVLPLCDIVEMMTRAGKVIAV